jgi:DNA-binding MarR family transcriptional regulator
MHPAAQTDTSVSAAALLRLVHWTSAASRQLRRRLAEIAERHDLTDNELLVLWISNGGGRVQIELAGEIGVSPAQISGIVERLNRRGLVEMRRQAVDRRRQVCETSAAGAQILARAGRDLALLARSLDEELSADEQQWAEALCQRLTAALKDAAQPGQRTGKEAA